MAKSPFLALVLSILVAGLGQIYVGRMLRGLALAALDFATGYAYMRTDSYATLMLNILVSAYAAVDAYRCAKEKAAAPQTPEAKKQPELRVY